MPQTEAPLIAACFWCGEIVEPNPPARYEKGILDYGPCTTCAVTWEAAECVILEIEGARPDGAPEFAETPGVAPTGRWATLTAAEFQGAFGDLVGNPKRVLVEKAVFDAKFKEAT